MVGMAVDRIRLSNSDDADVEDAKFVLGNADTNLDQEDILPSISNNSVDVDDGDGDSSAATLSPGLSVSSSEIMASSE
jgi:hypothetical protein